MDWETRTILASQEDVSAVSSMMIRYGGSFMSQIGKALEFADQDNVEKLRSAFRGEWDEYLELSRMSEKVHHPA